MRPTLRSLALVLIMTVLIPLPNAFAQTPRRLSEADLTRLIDLEIGDDAIIFKIRKDGVSLSPTEPVLQRLRKAGASSAVIDALKVSGRGETTTTKPLVSFDDLVAALKEGVDEEEIVKRLLASPTHFTLSEYQSAQLERLGASKRIVDALKTKPIQVGSAGSDITDLAIILDCSGSMKERTPDGESKMEAAKRVLGSLIPSIPNGLDVTVILYGFDARKTCDAVEVVRPISPLDDAGKQELLDLVAGLKPVGSTPIALALHAAGEELAKSEGLSEIVLVTDGMETCNGKPVEETLALMTRLNLKKVEVIGMGVNNAERAGLEEIAKAGKGHYYSARNAKEIAAAFEKTLPVGTLKVETAKISSTPAAVSGVVVTPLTLEGFPKVEWVALCTPGKGATFGTVQKTHTLGQVMLISPGTYDLWYTTRDTGTILVLKDFEVPAKQKVTVQSNRLVSAIVVNDLGLGVKIQRISVVPPGGNKTFNELAHCAGFGQPILVTPDKEYDVIVSPEGGEPVVVAERVRPRAGERLVVGGDAPASDKPGREETEETAPRLTVADPDPAEGAPAAEPARGPVTMGRVVISGSPEAAAPAAHGEMTPKVAELVTNLKSRNPQIRLRAAEQLGDLGDEAQTAVPALIDRVADMQGTVAGIQLIRVDASRIAALLAIKKLAPSRVEDSLRRAMKAPDFAMRIWAGKLLQGLNSNGAKTRPANSSGGFRVLGEVKTAPSSGFRTMGEVKTAPSEGTKDVGEPQSSNSSSLRRVDQNAYATTPSSKKRRGINANRFLGLDDAPQGGGFRTLGEVSSAPSGGFVGLGEVKTAPSGGFRTLGEVRQAR